MCVIDTLLSKEVVRPQLQDHNRYIGLDTGVLVHAKHGCGPVNREFVGCFSR